MYLTGGGNLLSGRYSSGTCPHMVVGPTVIWRTDPHHLVVPAPCGFKTSHICLEFLREEEEEMFTAVLQAILEQIERDTRPAIPRRRMHTSCYTGHVIFNRYQC
ncbi:hypothetical protein Taro_034143 [Colocasia esculenta]|uniref:Uncharacterized protein n=1 Tax=Colocasia esculenta TaxID=4460 RepID=A0A843VX13_COLES|nr:hypothetical protein [Colocasia esculenta]